MNFHESTLTLGNQQLALKTWEPEAQDTPPLTVLGLHGWLDNAATFDRLAPLLKNIRLITFDLPGHGRSSHRAEDAEYYIWSYIEDVLALADALKLEQFSLLGHSMGGAIACLFSALFPERVKKLALLDAVGPIATKALDIPAHMRKALKQKQSLKNHKIRYYPSLESAVEARANNGVRLESAAILAERAVNECEHGFYWGNDQRLSRPNLLTMTEEQVEAFFEKINCPTYLIACREFWQTRREFLERRLSYLFRRENFVMQELDGSHHQHLEGQVEQVATTLNQFLLDE